MIPDPKYNVDDLVYWGGHNSIIILGRGYRRLTNKWWYILDRPGLIGIHWLRNACDDVYYNRSKLDGANEIFLGVQEEFILPMKYMRPAITDTCSGFDLL